MFSCIFCWLINNKYQLTQNAASHAILQVIDLLDETVIRNTIIPKAKSVFDSSTSVQSQAFSLACLERLMDNLDKNEIANYLMPTLLNAKLGEPLVLMPVIRKPLSHSNSVSSHLLSSRLISFSFFPLFEHIFFSLLPFFLSPLHLPAATCHLFFFPSSCQTFSFSFTFLIVHTSFSFLSSLLLPGDIFSLFTTC